MDLELKDKVIIVSGGAKGIQAMMMAYRPALAMAGRGGLIGLAGAVGVGIGIALDQSFGLSDKLALTIGDMTGQSAELEELDALNGGRTNIRGMPSDVSEC